MCCVQKAGSEIRVQGNYTNPNSRTLLRLVCDGREHHWAVQCMFSSLLTKALIFPENFQRSGWEEARQEKHLTEESVRRTAVKKSIKKERRETKDKTQRAEKSSEDIARYTWMCDRRKRGLKSEIRQQGSILHGKVTSLAIPPHTCLTTFIPYILVDCDREAISHSG